MKNRKSNCYFQALGREAIQRGVAGVHLFEENMQLRFYKSSFKNESEENT